MNRCYLFCACPLVLSLGAATATQGAILGIDSVTLNLDDSLATATIGAATVSGGVIADSAEDARGSGITFPAAAGDPVPNGVIVAAADADQGLAYDNNVLTGNAGSTGNSFQNGGVMVLRWGSGISDSDSDPDFFIFEDSGNDTVEVQAILANSTLGAPITLSGWSNVSTSGVLGTNGTGGNLTGRNVSGVSFDFTDLLDASGAALAPGTPILGIAVGDSGAADFYEIYAAVDLVAIPEPSALALALLGCLATRWRR